MRVLAMVAIALVLLVVVMVLHEAYPVFKEVGFIRFIKDTSWHPTQNLFGLTPMLFASVISACGAVLIAAPAGMIAAIFCRFCALPSFAHIYKRSLAVFAGIPSVVYGFWGLTVLVPFIADRHPPGASLLTGVLILALMIFPTMALACDTALANVPTSYLSAGYALGMSKFAVIFKIALRAAAGGILIGALLSLTRALGETMAILMVSGNVVKMPTSLFDPVRTLAANIALEMAYATDIHRSALFASGGFLIVIVVVLMLISSQLMQRNRHG